MSILRFDQVALEFGDKPLLRGVDFVLEEGERVCLVGRNGAGKSSLLKLITGELQPDEGEILPKAGLIISALEQALPGAKQTTVQAFIHGGLGAIVSARQRYETLTQVEPGAQVLREMQSLQQVLDAHDGWHLEQRVATVMSELNLPGDARLADLSGGWQRRVSLARAMVCKPDLLLLDEPTNHLDLSTIEWLESRVRAFSGTVLFITHDRAFLQSLATRIVEIDRGQLRSWPGDYRTFLRRRQEAHAAEQEHNAEFDRRLAQEEAWIRQGVKARRTRNQGRVRALEQMREAREGRLAREHAPRVHIEEGNQSGRKVIEVRNLCYGYDDKPLIRGLSLRIMRGDRVALVGNNGVGKSTLLKLLLGELKPQSGTVKLGTHLEIGYFDQTRRMLDDEKTVAENIGEGREYIQLNGKPRHVVGYLRGFLFSAKRAMTPVKALSGGERNRVILAKLFTRAANLLVLDEPTNDLDVETLEVLEERLAEYQGTLIVVSHDRAFLDKVVDSVLVFEQDTLQHYQGTYSDWLRRGRQLANAEQGATPAAPATGQTAPNSVEANPAPKKRTGKLSYHLQRELDQLPEKIETMEQELAQMLELVQSPSLFEQDNDRARELLDKVAQLQQAIDAATARWEELEEGG